MATPNLAPLPPLDLPPDVLGKISDLLAPRDLLAMRGVSRGWRDAVQDSYKLVQPGVQAASLALQGGTNTPLQAARAHDTAAQRVLGLRPPPAHAVPAARRQLFCGSTHHPAVQFAMHLLQPKMVRLECEMEAAHKRVRVLSDAALREDPYARFLGDIIKQQRAAFPQAFADAGGWIKEQAPRKLRQKLDAALTLGNTQLARHACRYALNRGHQVTQSELKAVVDQELMFRHMEKAANKIVAMAENFAAARQAGSIGKDAATAPLNLRQAGRATPMINSWA